MRGEPILSSEAVKIPTSQMTLKNLQFTTFCLCIHARKRKQKTVTLIHKQKRKREIITRREK